MAVKLKIKVSPSKKEDKITLVNGELRVSLRAPAREGKANKALVDLFKKKLRLPGSAINILHGHKSRDKVISIETELSEEEVIRRLLE